MSLAEPLRIISGALTEDDGRTLPIGPGRWHVLFGNKQRPLLMPAATYDFQKRCLNYFVGGHRLKALYAKALLKVNSLVPSVRVLPEFRLPRARRSAFPCELPIRQPSDAAIQIGTPGPYQKASVLLMSECGEGLALAKVAIVPSADHMVGVEAGWLRELEGVHKLADQVPKLLAEGTALNGRRYLVTTLAPSTRMTSAFTPAHASFLEALGRARPETMSFEASPCFQYLQRTLAQLNPHVKRDALTALHAALRDCHLSLSGWTGSFVIAQGDFAPWNIRVHQQRIFVFDWEYARAGANPLSDVFNYFLIQQAVAGRRIRKRFLVTILHQAREIARQLYPEWEWPPRLVSGLALAYLLEVLLCYSRSGKRIEWAHPVIRSYWQLMERRREWLATA